MNTTQKVIKYFALGFAIFLIVTIISSVILGVLGVATAGKLISDNSSVSTKCGDEKELCLEVSLAISNLEIKKGDHLFVETKNEKVEVVQDDYKLVIIERGRHLFERYHDREVIVYIPEDAQFEKVGISGGAGNIYIESLYAKNLEMSLGIGKTEITSLETENAKISTGIGGVSVGLKSEAKDYEIKVSKGIGEISLNGKSIPDSTQGSGPKKVQISGGIGEVKITTR